MKNLKKRLMAGEAVNGCWLNSGSAINAEIVGQAGFDWVTIDLEHGVGTENNLLHQLQALGGSKTVPIARVEALVRQRVSRMLELGAEGIIFPQIQNREEAEQAISFMKYPPRGVRGMATMFRAIDFGRTFESYYAGEMDDVLGVIQIETLGSLEHLDEIANIDGVDVLFVGPMDLSLALGNFRQFDHPKYIDTMKKINEAARKAGKATGVLMGNPGQYKGYYELGFRMLGCGSDSVFLSKGASNMVRDMNEQLEKSK